MNAQERESVRVTLSVANNVYRKAQRKAKKRGSHPHRLKQGQPPEGRRINDRAVIIIAVAGEFFKTKGLNFYE